MILVRHALAEGDGRFSGQLDLGLTAEGRSGLPALVRKVSSFPISAVYASDLQRARLTARAIADHFGIELLCRGDLREMNFGEWQGLSWDEIEERFPVDARNWLDNFPAGSVPGGESFVDFKDRVNRELDWILGNNCGGCVAVVSHAGVMRVALASALDIPVQDMFLDVLPHCSIRVIDCRESGADLRCVDV